MDIDWKNPRQLDCPKKADKFDRERLARAKAKRAKRKPGKAHSTNRERSELEAAKARKIKDYQAKRDATFDTYINRVKAYWRGEIAEHPEKPL